MSKNTGFSFGMGSSGNIKANKIVETRSDKAKKEEDNLTAQTLEEASICENDVEANTEPTSSLVVSKVKASAKRAETKVSTSVALTSEAHAVIGEVFELNNTMKANTTINEVLKACYDNESKEFKQDIPAKETKKNYNYPIQISKKYKDALSKEAKKRNMTVGEYLSELIVKTVKFN